VEIVGEDEEPIDGDAEVEMLREWPVASVRGTISGLAQVGARKTM
jgi:hypothetical protein